ncbi:MAG: DUF1559 domain-containing protein [Planctomycetaceae bacterium]
MNQVDQSFWNNYVVPATSWTAVTDDVMGWGRAGLVGSPGGMTTVFYAASGCTIASMTDGTSNTIMIGELAGRQSLYIKGKLQPTSGSPPGSMAGIGGGSNPGGDMQFQYGGGRADPFNGFVLGGRDSSAPRRHPPTCTINCSNARGG